MPVSDGLARLGIRYWRTRRFWVCGLGRVRLIYHRNADSGVPGCGELGFRCNICGQANEIPVADLQREAPTCWTCGSTVRFRAVIHELSRALWDRSVALPDFPVRQSVTGLGLSDWSGYASRLSEKVSYINTFLHTEPRFDIQGLDPALTETQDFILASDVLEHVAPPIAPAFESLYRLLKPRGVLILTVPYTNEGETLEHFPKLYDYELKAAAGKWRLDNVTRNGQHERFHELRFHGGPGLALEMRLFARSALLKALADAGFEDIRLRGESCWEHGIVWLENHSWPIVARKPGRGPA